VLLIPGLASSAEHTFDLMPEFSLVNALVAKGYDVWMADLRGAHRDATGQDIQTQQPHANAAAAVFGMICCSATVVPLRWPGAMLAAHAMTKNNHLGSWLPLPVPT
jgi:alpha-beta hydrolase superfamily lysophospholipase